MDTDEGPLINENSNGLSHLLTEGEFNSVEAAVDDTSTSNQGFLNAVELSAGSVGDYLDNNTDGFNTDPFDVGDNATFPSDSLNNVLTDGDSLLSDTAYKATSDTDGDIAESQKATVDTDFEVSEMSDAGFSMPADDMTQPKTDDSVDHVAKVKVEPTVVEGVNTAESESTPAAKSEETNIKVDEVSSHINFITTR